MARILQVLEHGLLRIGHEEQGVRFEQRHWQQLFRYLDDHSARRYYDMRHDGVRFRNYVGVIQVGDLTIEILPKVDEGDEGDHATDATLFRWRDILLRMLQEAGLFPTDSLGNALLRGKKSSLLDVYCDLLLREVERLLHRGIVKRYRFREEQQTALRGALLFSKHVAQNLVHQERFFTRHQTYDQQHLHNQLLRQALVLLPRLSNLLAVRGRAARALLGWPETPPVKITPATFTRLTFNRKTEAYRPALAIARLLLLQYRPDLRGGADDLVALLFNMNAVWEQYLLRTMQRLFTPLGWSVVKPPAKVLWASNVGRSTLQPDILVTIPGQGALILDAKWKRPKGQPDEGDLRQLYAYASYYNAKRVLLLYPFSADSTASDGFFVRPAHLVDRLDTGLVRCSAVLVRVGQSSEQSGTLDQTGYLHCSLSSYVDDWLQPQAADEPTKAFN